MAKAKAAFIFVALDADSSRHKATISTPEVLDLTVIGVKDYQQAAQVAKGLVEQGCQAIELCGGFGNLGVAKVAQAVGNKASVGVVRFDCHPLLGFKSGDELTKE
jgi:riboflavin synthase